MGVGNEASLAGVSSTSPGAPLDAASSSVGRVSLEVPLRRSQSLLVPRELRLKRSQSLLVPREDLLGCCSTSPPGAATLAASLACDGVSSGATPSGCWAASFCASLVGEGASLEGVATAGASLAGDASTLDEPTDAAACASREDTL